MRTGICPKCKMSKNLTRHHIYPKRFFKHTKHKRAKVLICRECHNELETLIPQNEKMPDAFYIKIVDLFLFMKTYKPVL